MRKDKSVAIRLRKEGKSYREIQRLLGVPLSTLSDWFRDQGWSDKVRESLVRKNKGESRVRMQKLNRIRGHKLNRLYDRARREAKAEFKNFKYHPLFIAGLVIYWGEGDKVSRGLVRVSNIDPLLVKLFVKFLTDICEVEKDTIRASILIYPDLDSKKCKGFWVKNSGILEKNFNKSILIQGRHKKRRVHHGVCNVGITSTYLKEKIKVWLEMLPREMVSSRYYMRP
jgi:hypothetical protein